MKSAFYKNTLILTSSNITVGILGFIFSIYLSKILGAQGMALYSLVMPIYNLFISVMTAGVVAAISKISSIYTSEGNYGNLFKTIRTVAIFNFVWAIIIGIIVFFFAPFLGKNIIKDPRTITAIMVTCPAMVFIALSNILKGFFFGVSKLTIPSFIDMLEKFLRIFIIAFLIYVLKAKSLSELVTVAYIALCVGEFQSLILLFIYYKKITKNIKIDTRKKEGKIQLLANVLFISFPLCLNGFLNNIFYTISALIVPRRLVFSGFKYDIALSMIGKYTGMALTIVSFPAVIIGSLNTLLIPDLSQSINKGHYYAASNRVKNILKLVFLIGIGTTILCNIIPDSLGIMFYSRNDLGNYIRVASLTCPVVFLSSTMYGILNGLGKQNKLLRNTVITELLELFLLFILTSFAKINIYGYAISSIIVHSLSLILNLYEVNKSIELNLSIVNIIIFILISILGYYFINLLSNLLVNFNMIVKNIILILTTFLIFILTALKLNLNKN